MVLMQPHLCLELHSIDLQSAVPPFALQENQLATFGSTQKTADNAKSTPKKSLMLGDRERAVMVPLSWPTGTFLG